MSSRKQTFIQGAMILLAAGLVNRLLGFVPRIALPRLIGAEGVGLIQLVFPFLIVLVTIITGGLPLAVAKMVAEADSRGRQEEARRVMRIAMTLALGVSLASVAVCLTLADWISSRLMTDSRVHLAFLTIIPVLPLVAVSSVWRGYFQGKQDMIPTALSQTVETIIRIVITLLLAYLFLPWGLGASAAGAMLGTGAGELGGLLILGFQLRRDRAPLRRTPDLLSDPDPEIIKVKSNKTISRQLIAITLPVTGSRMIGSLSYLFESILTTRSLVIAGLTASAATAQYGALQGMVIPLLLLPGTLTFSLATSLIPSLSEAAARGDWASIQLRLHQSMRLAVVTGAPFALLMALFANPLCELLYANSEVGGLLSWLAPIAVFLYMQAPLQAALQALNRPGTALFNTFVGALVKLTLLIQLASRPDLGILGAVIAIAANMALVTLLHWISVARLTGFRLWPSDFLKVAAAMTIMGAAALWIWRTWSPSGEGMTLALASFAAILLYVALLTIMKLIDRHDLARIPVLGKLFR